MFTDMEKYASEIRLSNRKYIETHILAGQNFGEWRTALKRTRFDDWIVFECLRSELGWSRKKAVRVMCLPDVLKDIPLDLLSFMELSTLLDYCVTGSNIPKEKRFYAQRRKVYFDAISEDGGKAVPAASLRFLLYKKGLLTAGEKRQFEEDLWRANNQENRVVRDLSWTADANASVDTVVMDVIAIVSDKQNLVRTKAADRTR